MQKYDRYFKLIPAIACILCGLILAGNPLFLARIICRLVGGALLALCIIELANSAENNSSSLRKAYAIIGIVASAFLILFPGLILRSVSIIAGLFIGAISLHGLMTSLESRKLGRSYWPYLMGASVAGLILCAVMLTGSLSTTNIIIRLVGGLLILCGVHLLVRTLKAE